MRSTCPVCNQTADYPDRYANKWHRCQAGCQVAGTRLLLVPDGVARLQETAAGRGLQLDQQVVLSGIALVLVVALPFLVEPLGPAWYASLGVAGLAVAAAAWALTRS